MNQSRNATFAEISPHNAEVLSLYDAWAKMDSIVKRAVDAEQFGATVAGVFGSDAKFTPVGRLECPESAVHTLNTLGIDTRSSSVFQVETEYDDIAASVYAVAQWPGYYVIVRSYWHQLLNTRPIDLFVFRLVKS